MSIQGILKNEKKIENISRIVFSSVDKDGSGLIDHKELYLVIQSIYEDLGLPMLSSKDFKEVFAMLDRNKSGTINIREFKILIKCFLEYLSET